MKTFSQLRPKQLNEDLDYNKQMPVVLVLKRKSIRVFPDGMKVGMYYSDRLKKYISIPFGNDSVITDEA